MKKLIPTISMIALGAAMLGTSTYAWFSANTTVTATGLQMSAKASSSLLISNTSSSTGFSNTVALANDVTDPNTNFAPTQDTQSGNTLTFKRLTTADMQHVNPDGSIATGYTPVMEATTKDNYHDTVWLRYEGSSTATVTFKASIANAEATDAIYKAMHVAVLTGNTKYEIEFAALDTQVTCGSSISIAAGSTAECNVYAWVDGEDSDCKNANAKAGNTFTIDLEFSIPAAV